MMILSAAAVRANLRKGGRQEITSDHSDVGVLISQARMMKTRNAQTGLVQCFEEIIN